MRQALDAWPREPMVEQPSYLTVGRGSGTDDRSDRGAGEASDQNVSAHLKFMQSVRAQSIFTNVSRMFSNWASTFASVGASNKTTDASFRTSNRIRNYYYQL